MELLIATMAIAYTAFIEFYVHKLIEISAEGISDFYNIQLLQNEFKEATREAIRDTIDIPLDNLDTSGIETIFDLISSNVNQNSNDTFGYEFIKVLLLSDRPDVQKLSDLVSRHLRFQNWRQNSDLNFTEESIIQVLNIFISRLRLRLLDKPLYSNLMLNRENHRAFLEMGNSLNTLVEQNDRLIELTEARIAPEGASFPIGLINISDRAQQYVDRTDELEELKALILEQQVPKVTLRGIGGVGKSTLVEELARDDAIQARFEDGICILTVGQASEPYLLQKALADAVGDNTDNYSPDTNRNRIRLQNFLATAKCLIILDDVWDANILQHMDVLGVNSCLLLTTRINFDLGIPEIILQPMKPEESIQLLEKWTERTDPLFMQIAEKVGHLPLALRIAGARMKRGGLSPEEWLEKFNQVSRMKLHRGAQTRNDNLQVCFDLSIDFAFRDQLENKVLYNVLGIFPQDTNIPKSVVINLWQQITQHLDELDLIEYFEELVRLTIIQLNPSDSTISMHDLLQSYAEEALGNRISEIHAALLASYNPENLDWWNIAHDGYIYKHLLLHMKAAGYPDEERYKLLIASPNWMNAKYSASKGDGEYLADLIQETSDFKNPLSSTDVIHLTQLTAARHVVLQKSNNYENIDLQILVWLNREKVALEYASLRRDLSDQLSGKLAVYNTLHIKEPDNPLLEELLQEILATIKVNKRINGDVYYSTAKALIGLKHFQDASDIVQTYEKSEFGWEKSHLIANVAIQLALADAPDLALQLIAPFHKF